MRLGLISAGALAAAALAAALPAQDQRSALADARARSRAAARRSAALEAEAAQEKDAARAARTRQAALAARIVQAEADIRAGEARLALVGRMLGTQRERLEGAQGPIVRLVAALQSLAGRPALAAVVQPGSVDDLVHVRAVLSTALPVMRARTAALRQELARAHVLEGQARLATRALAESRGRLDGERLAQVQAEAGHRLRAAALGRTALFESDRAIALGERARDLVDAAEEAEDAAATGAELASLPGPLPRPGETAAAVRWPRNAAPYRLPVAGELRTGLGEVSEAGVRARGLTLAVTPGARVSAPAAGRVAYAASYRSYGRVVILDHGDGWSTLITGLAETTVRAGRQVAQGAPLGRAGWGEAPRITVELRRRGRPVDIAALVG
ncbi:murein hydrolase activator EnvC family protein [Sphingomonas aracearum]|uniref:Metalloendopeptidase n=1 Tax=Sphingomonas aracearum TaxID=2283317 RepID=A0A369VQV7_9SPHN|nr:peptidoglycan DD-metalloendopeptidase family protein [Sphingomonas aracearum]RDE04764.1 metalloendopeptidase [Sphingomonas aracearum]